MLGGTGSRAEDWTVAAVALLLAYVVIYPLYLISLRYAHSRRIERQLVTSTYKPPTEMTPVEFSYIFSSRVKVRQLYAALLDLANRSILLLHTSEGKTYVEIGPKVVDNLTPSEKNLVDTVSSTHHKTLINHVIYGQTTTTDMDNKPLTGSRSYVFWWLLRQSMRKRKIIESHMTGRYTKMLLGFGGLLSLVICLIAVVLFRLLEMFYQGEVDVGELLIHSKHAAAFWVIAILPVMVVSFFMLRLRGRMLGRHWLLTAKFKHFMNQLIAFKEYVRLTQKGSLRFESKELQKEARLHTKPYAIALGIIKELPPGK